MADLDALDPQAAGARRLQGKICVVTGAGQGIGSATARRFAAEGGTVVVADIVEATANKVTEELRTHGAEAMAWIGDLRELEGAEELMAKAKEAYGRIDVLVNNVGGTIWARPYWEYDKEQIITEVNKTFWPTMWCCHAVLPYMMEQRSGSIVNIGSNSPRGIYRVPYAASKGGVFAITTSLALELADYGVRVNCVAPHTTGADDRVTPRNPNAGEPTEQEKQWFKDMADRFMTDIPMKRRGKSEELAAAITFFASEDASFITGHIMPVAGGARVP